VEEVARHVGFVEDAENAYKALVGKQWEKATAESGCRLVYSIKINL
jgi:hypothetical protein